jgi:hypothetical protein
MPIYRTGASIWVGQQLGYGPTGGGNSNTAGEITTGGHFTTYNYAQGFPEAVLLTLLDDIARAAYSQDTPGFLVDAFHDVSGTDLNAHIGSSGVVWTRHPDFANAMVISDAHRARANTGSTAIYYADALPATAEYDVTANLFVKTYRRHRGDESSCY